MHWGQHMTAVTTTSSPGIRVRLSNDAPKVKRGDKADAAAAARHIANANNEAIGLVIHSLNDGAASKALSVGPKADRLKSAVTVLNKELAESDSTYDHRVGFAKTGDIAVVTSMKKVAAHADDNSVTSIIKVEYDDDGNIVGFTPKPESELEHHGILGMKWGRRRSEAQLESDTASRKAAGDDVTNTKKAAAVDGHQTFGAASGETSASRYARLAGEAKGGGASNWSEQDLKFFNARTDAVNKVNKMYAEKPSWLKETATSTLKTVAQQQMQSVASGVASKYISGPMVESLKGAKQVAESPPAQKAIAQTVASVKKSVPSEPSAKAPGMTPEQSLQYFRDHPPASPKPANYSPSGNFDLLKTLREEGLID